MLIQTVHIRLCENIRPCICHIYLVESCVKTGIFVYNLQTLARTRIGPLLMLFYMHHSFLQIKRCAFYVDQTLWLYIG